MEMQSLMEVLYPPPPGEFKIWKDPTSMCRSKPWYEAQKYLVPILSRRQTLIFLLSGHVYVVATGVENRTPPKDRPRFTCSARVFCVSRSVGQKSVRNAEKPVEPAINQLRIINVLRFIMNLKWKLLFSKVGKTRSWSVMHSDSNTLLKLGIITGQPGWEMAKRATSFSTGSQAGDTMYTFPP